VQKETVDSEVQIVTESEANPNVICNAKTQDILGSEVQFVTETENAREMDIRERELDLDTQESEADSDDHIPLVRLLRPTTTTSLTEDQIAACQEGPIGPRSIGVKVAKTFGDEKFEGTIDSFRVQRGRCIYHVTYTDGDEEELNQKELRDCYLLGLAPQIEREWAIYKKLQNKTSSGDTSESSVDGDNDDQVMSDGEGSLYDKDSDDEELARKRKKGRKEKPSRAATKKSQNPISGLVLPIAGDKTVAGEAFAKLNDHDKELVADHINRKTKKVFHYFTFV
jgi:hypothetical protein